MKILLLTNHSKNNQTLAEITAPLAWKYSARHGYDVMTLRMDWEESKVGFLRAIHTCLSAPLGYDAILTFGSDVLFMNHSLSIEPLLAEKPDVLMSREALGAEHGYSADGFSPINNDLVIWLNTLATHEFLLDLILRKDEWLPLRYLWQQWLAAKFIAGLPASQNNSAIPGTPVRLALPRVLQSFLQPCPQQFQPGDFALHLLAMPYAIKCAMARHYASMAVVD